MKQAEIILIENDEAYIEDVVTAFELSEHRLQEHNIGRTVPRALEVVEGLVVIKNKPIVVFLDGNLSEYEEGRSGSDAITVYRKMEKLNLFDSMGITGIKVVGFGSDSMASNGLRVHADPGKWNPEGLPAIVDRLEPTSSWMPRE